MRCVSLLLVTGLILTASTAARADEAWGKWSGAIAIPGQPLDVEVTLAAEKSSIDVPAQHAVGLPLSDVQAVGVDVAFTIALPTGPAIFKGKHDGEVITGDFTQGGQTFKFRLGRAVAAGPALPPLSAQDGKALVGDWRGAIIDADKDAKPLAIELSFNADHGVVVGRMAIVSQCLDDLPVTGVSLDANGKVHLDVQVAHLGVVHFDGVLTPDGLSGTYTRSQATSRFAVGRAPAAPPRPYREEQVSYHNGDVTLAGTLTLPKGVAHPPVVVTITGSGPQNRDECVVGVRPFAAIADVLARHGIAVLRSDDRGVASSTGDFAKATAIDFAGDTAAAIAYLKTRGDVDPRRIGLLGHSEGGFIAPMVAAKDPSVAFIVMMAGPGERLDQIILEQAALISRAEGEPEDQIARATAVTTALFAAMRAEPDPVKVTAMWKAIVTKALTAEQIAKAGGLDALLAQPTSLFLSDWFRFYLDYDPAETLAKVRCPVLALNGTRDLQVPYQTNLPAIKRALEQGKNRDFKIVELPELNHLFQRAHTGSPSEYATLSPALDQGALDLIAGWVVSHTRGR